MARILLVEDNEMNRDMLSRRLIKRGHEVVIAVDGQQGVDMATSEEPEIILFDMSLPVMDGFEFVMHYRQAEGCGETPIIVVTAKDLDQGEREKLLGGVERIVEKGALTRQQLLKQVRELVSQHGVPASDGNPDDASE